MKIRLLRKGKISQELADYMKNQINLQIEAIEAVVNSLVHNEPLPLASASTSKNLRNEESEIYIHITIDTEKYAPIFQQLILLGISFFLVFRIIFSRLKKYFNY